MGTPRPLKEKVIPKWRLGEHRIPYPPQPSQLVKDAVVLVIATGQSTTELVVHHPIGETNLQPDDWVATPIEEVSTLLARKDNPNKARIQEARSHKVMELLIANGLLKTDNGTTEYADNPELGERRLVLKDLRDPESDLTKEQRKLVEKLEKGILRFKTENNLQAVVEREIPDNYQTASGPLRDRPQRAVKGLTGYSPAQVVDYLLERIYSTPRSSSNKRSTKTDSPGQDF